jgi:hypothetical protein
MEADTAAKIQMVYENALKVLVPLTPIARAVKRSISAGPVAARLPWKYINNAAIKLKPAMINAKE